MSFSGDVTVTGSPHLTLNVGGTSVNAEFTGTSGSPASSHTFRYTVAGGHNDDNGIQVTGWGGTPAFFSGPFTLLDVKIDTSVPAVPTLSFVTPGPSYDATPDLSFDPVLVGDKIKLYKSVDCSGSVFMEETAVSNPEILTVSDLGDDGDSNFTAKVVDLSGNESACSSSVSYTLSQTWAKRVVESGESHSCALSENGQLKCWGKNDEGQLGLDGDADKGDAPGEMGEELSVVRLGTNVIVREISVGGHHSCAVLSDGGLKCWGKNTKGQLGQESMEHQGDASGEMAALAAVNLGSGVTVKQVSAGHGHSCALLSNDQLKCWGGNSEGQLGQGDRSSRGVASGEMASLSSINFGSGLTAEQVSAGGEHTCAILSNAQLKCWGRNNEGQLGLDDRFDRGDNPHEMLSVPGVDLGEGLRAKRVSTGRYHTCALLSNDKLKCWGKNSDGQLGQGDTDNKGGAQGDMASLSAIDFGSGVTVKEVAAGYRHTCALLSNDQLKCWGGGSRGQLGLGNVDHQGDDASEMGVSLLPLNLGTGLVAKAITAGGEQSCAFLSDETFKCWGRNDEGQLGQGNTDQLGDGAGEMGNALLAINLGSQFADFQLSSLAGTTGSYGTGAAVSLTATFSSPVTFSNNGGSHSPRLILDVGGSRLYATYTGDGALGAAHTFSYTVSDGDDDRDGIDVTGIDLQGGHIQDAFGSGLSYPGAVLNATGVLVDAGIAPELTQLSDDTVATKTKIWSWGCSDASPPCQYRFVVNTSAAHVFQTADTWVTTATATQSVGTGTYYLHIQAKDNVGNESAVEHFSAVLDNTPPALQGSIEAPSNGTYVDTGAGSVLEFALSYDEDVVVGGTPFLSLDIGGQSKSASYVGASSTARRLVFRYAVQAVDSDSDGITWDGAIQLGAGGSLGDAPGNAVEVTGLTVPSLTGVLVSGGATRVTGITGTDGWYKLGDEIILTVNFSGAVTVTGVPHLVLNVGGTSVSAEFSGTSGSPAASSQTFSYTVASGHNDPNGIDVTGLVLESGESVVGSSGTEATLNGTYSLSGVKIDTTAPAGFRSCGWTGRLLGPLPAIQRPIDVLEVSLLRLRLRREGILCSFIEALIVVAVVLGSRPYHWTPQ